jgi:hypothetical protein
VLLGDAVPQSLPNDYGVMLKVMGPEPLIWKGAKKSEWLNVDLAFHYEQRTWHSAAHIHEGTMGAGTPARASEGHPTRHAAVLAALHQIKSSVGRHADESKAVALVEEMIAAIVEAFFGEKPEACGPGDEDAVPSEDGPLDDLVPANAEPEVEAFAKENGMELMKPAKPRGGKRERNEVAEKIALKTYLETGSIAKAAEACGLDVESVKNWHKRRGWKARREAHQATAK